MKELLLMFLRFIFNTVSPSTGLSARQQFFKPITDNNYYKIISYTNRHKYYVLCAGIACLQDMDFYSSGFRRLWLSIQFLCRLIIHDIDKYKPSMLHAYAEAFYGDKGVEIPATGYFHKPGRDLRYDRAWKKHQAWAHHWQAHVLIEDSGTLRALDMPLMELLEMVVDWRGAGRAQGKPDYKAWYLANYWRMTLHENTRAFIEWYLQVSPADKEKATND